MRTTLLCLLAALAANLLFVWWGRTTFVPLGLVVVGGWLLAFLLAVLGAIIYGFSRKQMNDHVRLTLRYLLFGIVFFCSTTAGLPWVRYLIKVDVAATRSEAENLAVRLDAYQAAHGAFPASLDEVAPSAGRSRLLRRHDAYHATGTSYVFRIRIPGHPLAGEIYHSQDRTWRLD